MMVPMEVLEMSLWTVLLLAPFALGAFSGSDINLARQRVLPVQRDAAVQIMMEAFFEAMVHEGNPDLQYVTFTDLENNDEVILAGAGAVCMVYIKKPSGSTTTAYWKASDHATVASADEEMGIAMDNNDEQVMCFPAGVPQGTGFTVGAHTTAAGSTKSAAADAPSGFVLLRSAARLG